MNDSGSSGVDVDDDVEDDGSDDEHVDDDEKSSKTLCKDCSKERSSTVKETMMLHDNTCVEINTLSCVIVKLTGIFFLPEPI